MKILFVHQNFPGQYLHLARHLGRQRHNEVVFITQRAEGELPGVRKIVYRPARKVAATTHHYLRDTEAGVLNAQAVARAALELKASGFVPDVMLAHNGWGELWYLKDVFPHTPLIGYLEFFYHAEGADVGFETQQPPAFDTRPRLRMKNVGNLLALQAIDLGQTPTWWQRSLYPAEHRSRIQVVHEGIDTARVRPDDKALLAIPGSDRRLTGADEVVTYVARNLEPYVVVGSATAPVEEVIRHGENGWLVDFHDPAAIAARVIEVLNRCGEQEAIRLAARCSIVDNYDLQTVCLPAQLQLLRTALQRGT